MWNGFQNMHVLSSLFYDLHIKARPPLDVLWSKPGKMISPEYQNMIAFQVNNTATLVCEYDLRGEPLYSVKWLEEHDMKKSLVYRKY